MPRFEAKYPIQIDNREGVSTPPWSELAARNFPNESMPGSIGAAYFDTHAELWKGRKRPVTIFQQPIEYLWGYPYGYKKEGALSELREHKIETVSDLMQRKEEAFTSFRHVNEIQAKVGIYLAELAFTPHAKLLKGVYKRPQYVVPPAHEDRIVAAVNAGVEALSRFEKTAIRYGFGLEDGVVGDVEIAVFVRGDNRGQVKTIKHYSVWGQVVDGLASLRRYPSTDGLNLKNYCSLPEASIGRIVFGGVLFRDIPQIDGDFSDLRDKLSPTAFREVMQIWDDSEDERSLEGLIRVDLLKQPLSPGTLQEVGAVLQEISKAQAQERQDTFRARQGLIEILEARQQPTNRLLPALPISTEDLARLSGIPIDDLDISTYTRHVLQENNVETAGQIISLTVDQLRELDRLGKRGLSDLASGLQKILPLWPDEYPPDTLEKLLLPPPPLPKGEAVALKVQENMAERLREAQAIIADAQLHGCNSASEIQDYLVLNKRKLVSTFTPQDWITRAVIEYVLNTMQNNSPKK